jgi:hypothetical protein
VIEYYKNLSIKNLPYVNEEGLVCWEEFKDIPEYEGLYQVSDLGRVKSLNYNHTGKEGLLKQCFNGNKYLTVNLHKKGSQKNKRVHQLVAIVFLNHKLCGQELVVNHKKFIRSDNRVENLEIVTNRENTNQKHMESTSKFTGVYWNKSNKKWRATIEIKGVTTHLGYFNDELEASQYYENALIAIQNGTEVQIKYHKFSSQYHGVCWDKMRNKWKARLKIDRIEKHIGNYFTEIEAHHAVEKFKKELIK